MHMIYYLIIKYHSDRTTDPRSCRAEDRRMSDANKSGKPSAPGGIDKLSRGVSTFSKNEATDLIENKGSALGKIRNEPTEGNPCGPAK